MSIDLEAFLNRSPVARKAKLGGRVILRRFTRTTAELGREIESGGLMIEAEPLCELVVGGITLARGRIVERDGSCYFSAEEAI